MTSSTHATTTVDDGLAGKNGLRRVDSSLRMEDRPQSRGDKTDRAAAAAARRPKLHSVTGGDAACPVPWLSKRARTGRGGGIA